MVQYHGSRGRRCGTDGAASRDGVAPLRPRKYSYASLCRMDYIMVLPGFKGVSTFRTCALRVKGNLGGHPGIRQSRGQEQHDPSRDAAPIPIRMRRRTTRESARAGCIRPRLSP
jgi:hypothetical protein